MAMVANQAYAAPEMMTCALVNLAISILVFIIAKIKLVIEKKDEYRFAEEYSQNVNKAWGIILTYVVVAIIVSCVYINNHSNARFDEEVYGDKSDYSSDYSSSYSDDYDYDKGYGYTSPEEGESLSDYIKRQDPELWEEMEENWDSMY